MECLQLSVNKEVPKTILQCNNPSRRGNRQSFPRSLASFTFTDPDDLKIQRTSKRIVFPLTNRDFPALSLPEPFGEWLRSIDRKDQKMLIERCYTLLLYVIVFRVSRCVNVFPRFRVGFISFAGRGCKRCRDKKKQRFHHSREIEFRLQVISYLEFCLNNPFLPLVPKTSLIYHGDRVREIKFNGQSTSFNVETKINTFLINLF